MSRTRSRRLLALLLPLAALPLAAACGSDPIATTLPPEARIDTTTFAPSLGINLAEFTRMDVGVYYKDLVVGTGDSTVAAGKTVSAHYIGWLPNGTIFDRSSPDRPPFSFTIGEAGSIPGFQAGVLGMREGGRRIIIIPPSLGYGYEGSRDQQGRVVIPGNSVILFRVDVYTISSGE